MKSRGFSNALLDEIVTPYKLQRYHIDLFALDSQVEPSSVKEACSALPAVVGEALLALIARPQAIRPRACPEALLLDAPRLVAAQNELQRLSLVGASLLVAQMLLGAKGLPSSPATAENRRRASRMASSLCMADTDPVWRLLRWVQMPAEQAPLGGSRHRARWVLVVQAGMWVR